MQRLTIDSATEAEMDMRLDAARVGAEVVDACLVQEVFGIRARVVDDPTTGTPLVLPEPRSRR